MASERVIPRVPPLSVWASSRLNSLLRSETTDRFNRIFDATFAQDLEVVLNGKTLTRDEYKKVLLGQSGAGPSAITDVHIEGETVVNPITSEDRLVGGFVGMFYTLTSISKRFFVLGAPARHKDVSTINLTVKSTVPYPATRFRYPDPRRITAVNQILQPKTLIVSFPGSVLPANQTSGSGKVELGPVNHTQVEEELSVLGNKFSTASVPEADIDEE
ncbi:hypothetical protein BKA82DRAFT_991978 [Pisolithus tinctorius]|uniref:NTF2 domain-containing protein n=1 Tax=Pisolithus tinctorius Marx 270 TaxID=870435 RepID=A0A0C3Q073_PISTI|nr:hypothetical protein BKA82DRAFT_991978 [Pisolithus tinctorius]KIO15249.1 hypothetical protein M404DRAFT_991978 [Pisolithus tinctorius Marx 270]